MENKLVKISLMLLIISVFIETAYAEDSFIQQFLGSPLLALAAIIAIAAVASIYHKIRK